MPLTWYNVFVSISRAVVTLFALNSRAETFLLVFVADISQFLHTFTAQ